MGGPQATQTGLALFPFSQREKGKRERGKGRAQRPQTRQKKRSGNRHRREHPAAKRDKKRGWGRNAPNDGGFAAGAPSRRSNARKIAAGGGPNAAKRPQAAKPPGTPDRATRRKGDQSNATEARTEARPGPKPYVGGARLPARAAAARTSPARDAARVAGCGKKASAGSGNAAAREAQLREAARRWTSGGFHFSLERSGPLWPRAPNNGNGWGLQRHLWRKDPGTRCREMQTHHVAPPKTYGGALRGGLGALPPMRAGPAPPP